jgi:hypothetical protein
MIEVKCPRCEREWYTEKHKGGRVRLCSDCADELRSHGRSPFRIDAFMIATAGFLGVNVIFILLTFLRPDAYGDALRAYGAVLFLIGSVVSWTVWWFSSDGTSSDWTLARWPVMVALMGLSCILAYFSFIGRG